MGEKAQDWRAKLAKKVGGILDEEWDTEPFSVSRGVVKMESREVTIPIDLADAAAIFRSIGRVNGDAVDGRIYGTLARGTVLLCGIEADRYRAAATFRVRRCVPWNHFQHPETGQLLEFTDASGQPPYPYDDFAAPVAPKAETWRDRSIKDPLL